jgi:hypothetical protein
MPMPSRGAVDRVLRIKTQHARNGQRCLTRSPVLGLIGDANGELEKVSGHCITP